MRYFPLVILLFIIKPCFSQLTIKSIFNYKKNSDIQARIRDNKTIFPSNLPFWDDFSITTNSPDALRIWGTDTTSQWNYELSKDVFVNATLAINPPSYRVATLDGLDVNGEFHGNGVGLTDQLVSDTIDIQGKANVLFSFYWQAGGNVEIPEARDSLILEFYNPNNPINPWKQVWKKDGGELKANQDTIFTQEAVVVDSEFLTQKFMFRFQSYGDQDGPFDAWHLDWIYLNDNRDMNEINQGYEDGAFTSDLSSILSPYYSIPINQFMPVKKYIQNQSVSLNYLNQVAGNIYPVDLTYQIVLKNNDSLLVNDRRGANPLFPNGNMTLLIGFTEELQARDPLVLKNQNFTPIFQFDSVVIESSIYFFDDTPIFLDRSSTIDLRINDTVRTQYLLSDYYAYDDGTAEYAVGTNISGGQVAIQFFLENPDTLTHIDIYFPNIDPASSSKILTLMIFNSLTDDSTPLRSQQVFVENGTSINEFTRYKLQNPVVLTDTFFIGYQQHINEYIGIGFDRNNLVASNYIFENSKGQWEQNQLLKGALMIRPVFSTPDLITSINSIEPLKVYPNPTKGQLTIEGHYYSISIVNLSGRVLLKQQAKPSHDLTTLNQGLYLLIIHKKEGTQTLKIIKK